MFCILSIYLIVCSFLHKFFSLLEYLLRLLVCLCLLILYNAFISLLCNTLLIISSFDLVYYTLFYSQSLLPPFVGFVILRFSSSSFSIIQWTLWFRPLTSDHQQLLLTWCIDSGWQPVSKKRAFITVGYIQLHSVRLFVSALLLVADMERDGSQAWVQMSVVLQRQRSNLLIKLMLPDRLI